MQHIPVSVDGIQHCDCSIKRTVRVTGELDDDANVDATLVRRVAVALLDAADEIEQLANR